MGWRRVVMAVAVLAVVLLDLGAATAEAKVIGRAKLTADSKVKTWRISVRENFRLRVYAGAPREKLRLQQVAANGCRSLTEGHGIIVRTRINRCGEKKSNIIVRYVSFAGAQPILIVLVSA